MKYFEKFLDEVKTMSKVDQFIALRDRIKPWHDLVFLRYDTSFTNEENADNIFNRFGDMIDYDSCKRAVDIIENVSNCDRIIDKKRFVEQQINVLEYRKRILKMEI